MAQLGYTVPFTLVLARKYRTKRQIKHTDNPQTKYSPEKANNAKYCETQLPWFSRLLRHSARKWGGLIW